MIIFIVLKKYIFMNSLSGRLVSKTYQFIYTRPPYNITVTSKKSKLYGGLL